MNKRTMILITILVMCIQVTLIVTTSQIVNELKEIKTLTKIRIINDMRERQPESINI